MIQILGISKMPLVNPGDNIGDQLVQAAKEESIQIQANDILVVAQKIVSKAEGKFSTYHRFILQTCRDHCQDVSEGSETC